MAISIIERTVSAAPQLQPSLGPSDHARVVRIALCLALFLAAWANWREPVLRFAWQPLNIGVFLLALLAPAAALATAVGLRRRWARWSTGVLLLPLAVGAGLFALLVAFHLVTTLQEGADASFAPLRALAQDGYVLRVYRTNGGAATAFGAVVRQERTLLPGLRLVRTVYHAYPAEDARVDRVATNQFVFDGRAAQVRTLSPWVWM